MPSKHYQLTVRIAPDLEKQLDEYIADTVRTVGIELTRPDAARVLIKQALQTVLKKGRRS